MHKCVLSFCFLVLSITMKCSIFRKLIGRAQIYFRYEGHANTCAYIMDINVYFHFLFLFLVKRENVRLSENQRDLHIKNQ